MINLLLVISGTRCACVFAVKGSKSRSCDQWDNAKPPLNLAAASKPATSQKLNLEPAGQVSVPQLMSTKLDVGLSVVIILLEFCTTYSSSSPVVTITCIILCFNKHRLTPVHLANGR